MDLLLAENLDPWKAADIVLWRRGRLRKGSSPLSIPTVRDTCKQTTADRAAAFAVDSLAR